MTTIGYYQPFEQNFAHRITKMTTTDPNQADPPEIYEKVKSLQIQKELIEDLTARLMAARIEHDQLEKELEAYRASVAPIRRCPEEVLLMTFGFFCKQDSRNITRLLAVCKRWRDIALNSPKLWAYITIRLKHTWDQGEDAWKHRWWIGVCLERSASQPLHIKLYLQAMPIGEQRVDDFLTKYWMANCSKPTCKVFRGHIKSLREEGRILEDICRSCGTEEVERIITKLVGNKGENMSRWESLHISLPHGNMDLRKFWPLFCGPSPKLTEMVLSGHDMWYKNIVSAQGYAPSFPDLSSLEDITVRSGIADVTFLSLNFTSVTRLALRLDLRNAEPSFQISQFTSLEHLDISFLKQSGATSPMMEICLPLLKSLDLYLHALVPVEWSTPVLEKLTLSGVKYDQLPSVRALHIVWSLYGKAYVTELEPTVKVLIQEIVDTYRDMEKLTLPSGVEHVWETFVKELREESRLGLPTITFYG